MITLGNNVFFFGQSSNGIFNMSLYKYEIETETLTEEIQIIDPPFNSDLYPVGFQDGYIYYFGNLDPAFGVEIYRSEIGISTATDEIIQSPELNIEQLSSNTFKLSSEVDNEILVNIYNASGQRLQQEYIDNDGIIVIEHTGFLYISASQSGVEKTFTKLINE
jgi:hypothetical protein